MTVTTELRGDHYRDNEWVDRHGWVWGWDAAIGKWRGRSQEPSPWGAAVATDDEVSDYSQFGGRGPFLKLAP